jgi:transposase
MLTLVTGGEVKERIWISSIKIDENVWFVALLIGRSSMSLKSQPIPPIPEEIVRIAHAVFPRGNVFMQVRDVLGTIYADEAFADLFPTHGQPAFAPWRLALVTIFQFMEGLTDRQAAGAVRDRLAWKYALSLELCDAGFDHTVLSEFRSRLVEGYAEQRLLDLRIASSVGKEGGGIRPRTTTNGLHAYPRENPFASAAPCALPRRWSTS